MKKSRKWIRRAGKAVALCYGYWLCTLVALKWMDPWTTGVQAQRRFESWFRPGSYEKRYTPVPMAKISPQLRRAVVAAEDGRFHEHWGLDLGAMAEVAREGAERGTLRRGASTITQQLVKNLYFTTHANPVRKVVEWTLAPAADFILGKERVLELYLNVIEWGPGVFGAEEAARYHYRGSAAGLGRDQATRLAACIPAPRRRRPAAMNRSAAIIDARMRTMGYP
ncbi:MAG: monofunctional biosynthetic peptidoglycan transglycosylase [Acidobacteria bacterium]|nr:monofunctional biosynthetic peptidoglycan transglycosylase [Acidobacteriota bacterium]